VKKTEEMAEAWWFPGRDKIVHQIDVFCYFEGKQQSFYVCGMVNYLPSQVLLPLSFAPPVTEITAKTRLWQ
jgi:hypothetical protein